MDHKLHCLQGPERLFKRVCVSQDRLGRMVVTDGPQITVGYNKDLFLTPAAHLLWTVILLFIVFSPGPRLMEKPLPGILPHS